MGLLDDLGLSLPGLLLVILVVTGLFTLAVAGSTSSQAFGTFNAAWDGSSSVRTAAADTGAEVDVATETSPYDDAGPETVALVLAPTDPYNESDIARMRGFVERGGTLVVAEDVGPGGNRLLQRLGSDLRFDGRVVVDQRRHGPTTEMPIATTTFDSRADEVMLNRGTVLTSNSTANTTVLARTSEFAFLDGNDNGEIDDNETLQSYPVAAAESLGSGQVIAVSDPSVFINAMQSRADNAAFFTALVDDSPTVLLDYSHTGSQPPVWAAVLWLRRTPLALAGLGLCGLLAVGHFARRGRPTLAALLQPASPDASATAVDERSLAAYVARVHPEWDAGRARRLIADIISTDEKNERD